MAGSLAPMNRQKARAYAGIVAPLVAIAVLLIQGATTPGYDPILNTISELGSGWRGTGVVAAYGLFVVCFVWEEVARSVPPTGSMAMWISALVAIGIGCMGLAVSSPEPWPWNSMGWEGRLHLIFAFVFVFAAIPIACLAASRALPAAWPGLRLYSLVTGLGSLALLAGALMALRASPPNRFVVTHLGLIERVYVFAFMIWQCIVSTRLARRAPNAR